MRNRLLAGLVAATLALAFTPAARAQDSHYWFDQFGNRALLLSGAVVGDPADLSSVYYNPGGLSLVDQTELLLAGLVISIGNTTLEDAVGPGADSGSSGTDSGNALDESALDGSCSLGLASGRGARSGSTLVLVLLVLLLLRRRTAT